MSIMQLQIMRDKNATLPQVDLGDVLQFEGYGDNRYVIIQITADHVHSFNITKPDSNARLLVTEKRSLRPLSEKFGIGVYTTGLPRHSMDQVESYEAEHIRQKAKLQDEREAMQREADRLEAIGRELWPKLIGDCSDIMIAEFAIDQSDCQTDYFGHSIGERVILAPSKHSRDLFPEMRKAAALIPETEHLTKQPCIAYVVFSEDNYQGTHAHYKGQISPWHRGLSQDEDGNFIRFDSPEAAQAFIDKQEPIHQVKDGETVYSFMWEIEEKNLEHREKYSMGAGYYLGEDRHSGWKVFKYRVGTKPRLEDYRDLARRHDHFLKPAKAASKPPKPSSQCADCSFSIEEHTHTKHGFQMWIVVLSETVDRAAFNAMLESAKGFGGWYSRAWGSAPGGFAFKSLEAAQGFASGLGGKNPEPDGSAPTTSKPQTGNKAEKFLEMADKMESEIEAMRAPLSQNPTPKRTLHYRSRIIEADHLERVQTALRKLATLHDAGEVPGLLKGFTSKAALLPALNTRKDTSGGYYEIRDTGIYTDKSPEAVALQELLSSASDPEGDKARELRKREQMVRDKILSLSGQRIEGFFPTPQAVTERMLYEAELKPGQTVLEPSAGTGNIADAARQAGGKVVCVELRTSLSEILEIKGHETINDCFLDWSKETTERFDLVLMNPPFEKGQDALHVRAAFDRCLKPGGRLVAIMGEGVFFRSDSASTSFRDWLDSVGGVSEKLPDGSFKGTGEISQTGTSTRIVVINK